MKNSQRQSRWAVIQPPSVGPSAGASVPARPRIAGMRACFSPVNRVKPAAKVVGTMAPPTKPWIVRKNTMDSMFQDRPQPMLASVKPAADSVNSQRVDSSRLSQPDSGIMITSVIR